MLPSWWARRATRPPILGRMRVVPKIGGPGAAPITCMARHCHARLASRWQSQPTRPTAAHTTDATCRLLGVNVCRLRSQAASREARRSTLAQARGRRAGAAWLSTVATRGGVVANGTCKSHFVHWFSAPVRQQQHPSRPPHACPVSFALHFRTALPRLLCQSSAPWAQQPCNPGPPTGSGGARPVASAERRGPHATAPFKGRCRAPQRSKSYGRTATVPPTEFQHSASRPRLTSCKSVPNRRARGKEITDTNPSKMGPGGGARRGAPSTIDRMQSGLGHAHWHVWGLTLAAGLCAPRRFALVGAWPWKARVAELDVLARMPRQLTQSVPAPGSFSKRFGGAQENTPPAPRRTHTATSCAWRAKRTLHAAAAALDPPDSISREAAKETTL